MARLTYAVIADELDALPAATLQVRQLRRLSVRAAARQIGINFSTLSRFECGHNIALDNAVAILRWLDGGAE